MEETEEMVAMAGTEEMVVMGAMVGKEMQEFPEKPDRYSKYHSSRTTCPLLQRPLHLGCLLEKRLQHPAQQVDNDIKISTSTAVNGKVLTGLDVASGDSVCMYVEEQSTPDAGWIAPNGNLCGNKTKNSKPKDISALMPKFRLNQAPIIQTQCWGDPDPKLTDL